jgi:hypothetical protein
MSWALIAVSGSGRHVDGPLVLHGSDPRPDRARRIPVLGVLASSRPLPLHKSALNPQTVQTSIFGGTAVIGFGTTVASILNSLVSSYSRGATMKTAQGLTQGFTRQVFTRSCLDRA